MSRDKLFTMTFLSAPMVFEGDREGRERMVHFKEGRKGEEGKEGRDTLRKNQISSSFTQTYMI